MTQEETISLAHGNGGKRMRMLVEEVFYANFANDVLSGGADGVHVPSPSEMVVTTDGFTVDPIEFPGGDIGKLAACGIINDLAVSGATPRYITVSVFIEEGFSLPRLKRLVQSMAAEIHAAGAKVIAGDTKVLPRGHVNGVYFSLTGIGEKISESVVLGFGVIEAGDQIAISGGIGEHGAAVLLAREQFGLRGELASDCASVLAMAQYLCRQPGVKFMRDPTRGGIATVCYEIAQHTEKTLALFEQSIPTKPSVQAVCELLGLDPLYLASEGRILFIANSDAMPAIMDGLKQVSAARDAAVVGRVRKGEALVQVETSYGGRRWLPELDAEPLPRIC
jgi:hydrogenase expression/formation protein HypE